MIYLDTHVLVWLYEKFLDKLSKKVKNLLEKEEIFISPMVELELDFLYEVGRLRVHGMDIVRELDVHLGVQVSRVDFYKVIEEASHLSWTRDPFDRLIVANAVIFQAQLITKDKTILKHYPFSVWG